MQDRNTYSWVHVSDNRKPENGRKYLVTETKSLVPIERSYINGAWVDEMGNDVTKNVIAWFPQIETFRP